MYAISERDLARYIKNLIMEIRASQNDRHLYNVWIHGVAYVQLIKNLRRNLSPSCIGIWYLGPFVLTSQDAIFYGCVLAQNSRLCI